MGLFPAFSIGISGLFALKSCFSFSFSRLFFSAYSPLSLLLSLLAVVIYISVSFLLLAGLNKHVIRVRDRSFFVLLDVYRRSEKC